MGITTTETIENIKKQIRENNDLINKKSKENIRLFDRLIALQKEIPQHRKYRYDKELASGNWKETDYWKKSEN